MCNIASVTNTSSCCGRIEMRKRMRNTWLQDFQPIRWITRARGDDFRPTSGCKFNGK
jgi:hypothetical protein